MDVPETVEILIVDDDPGKRMALEAALAEVGQHVVHATSGKEALRCLLRRDFAVILLDVNMPGMDGFETAALIRQRKRSEHTPIIFITAYGDETHVARGYSLGAVDYLLTPVVSEVLRTKVGVFVDLYRKTAELIRQSASLEQRALQLHRLTQAAVAINAAGSVERIIEVVTEHAREVADAYEATAEVAVDERHTYSARARSEEWAAAPAIGRAAPVTMLVTPNTATPPGPGAEDVPDPTTSSGGLTAPLTLRDGRRIGFIQVRGKREGRFTSEDAAILVQLTQMTAIVIDNLLYTEERETNRLKDEFLATVSHELRTPLTAVLTWARLLRTENLDPAVLARGVAVIERNAKAQAQLIGDLLDMSRIITGKLPLDRRLLDLQTVVKNAIDSVGPAAQAKTIELVSTLQPPGIPVHGDADRLQQVMWNLLSNAIKFTPAGGRIEVRLGLGDGHAEIRVCDTGKGISPGFLPHVFDRFRQADNSTTRAHGGLGLGLAIVRHLTELHGGSVRAESAGEGCGATFVVTLPVASDAAASGVFGSLAALSDAPGRPAAEASLEGLRIVVVEDEVDGREAIGFMLSEAGAEVRTAGSVAAALAAIADSPPDIVLSDIGLPVEDGYVLIERLKALEAERGVRIPAVALTAYAHSDDRARALEAGYQEHLAKPVEASNLLATLARFCSRDGSGRSAVGG